MAKKKAYSYAAIDGMVFKTIPLKNEWLRHQGEIELSGSIIIYGDSGHGKTSYAMQYVKAIAPFYKVHYNSAEEGIRASFQRSLRLNNMKVVKERFAFSKERFDDMVLRLRKKRQPKVWFIDSVQYCFEGKTKKSYFDLIEEFKETLFIFISHIDRGKPIGQVAKAIYWDCQNRILIKDFKAYIEKSRCGADETEPYIINKEKAAERELKLLKHG